MKVVKYSLFKSKRLNPVCVNFDTHMQTLIDMLEYEPIIKFT